MIKIIKEPGHDKTGKLIEIGDFVANYQWAVIACNKTEKSYYFIFPSDQLLNQLRSGKMSIKELRKRAWRTLINNTNRLTIITPESFDKENDPNEVRKVMEIRELILKLYE